jgi:anti-sigma factor RsiW
VSRTRHLPEERLVDCYVAERGDERLDPPTAEHLVDCAECAARYADLVRLMDELREEADAETDAIFTPERLSRQQLQIARRLEHLGHVARVISFPGRLASGKQSRSASARAVPRWIAAAAAAGLFIGVSAGMYFDRATDRLAAPAAPLPGSASPAVVSPASQLALDDDAFLSAIELALGGPRNRELAPFDVLTPRVQEVSAQVR